METDPQLDPPAGPVGEPSQSPVEPIAPEGAAVADAPPDTSAEVQDDTPPAGMDELADLAERAKAARLAPADEERMCALLKDALLGGKAGAIRAAEFLPRVPWIVGVRAVESVWAEMKVTARTHVLKSLAENEAEPALRIRLSLARALSKLDAAVGLKLLVGVCREMLEKGAGTLDPRHAQILNNVLVGKARPWVTQLALSELKPADAETLVQCALMAGFSTPNPPVPQLSLLRWAGEADKLAKPSEALLGALSKGLSRMGSKWQNALRKEVQNLPEEIAALLKPAQESAPASPTPRVANADRRNTAAPVREEETENAPSDSPVNEADEDRADDTEEDEKEAEDDAAEPEERPRKQRPPYEPRPQRTPLEGGAPEREGRRDRPAYQSRTVGREFNLGETLRQIDNHVQFLKSELQGAQNRLRQRDDDSRREVRRVEKAPAIVGAPTPEELARLNVQLEARIGELQARIEELSGDAEDRAASMGAHADQPAPDQDQQLRTLLALKLQEDYADFLALETESTSTVVQQHYRTLLRHIFEVLKVEGVGLQP